MYKGDQLIEADVETEHLSSIGVLPDCDDRPAETRCDDSLQGEIRCGNQDHEGQIKIAAIEYDILADPRQRQRGHPCHPVEAIKSSLADGPFGACRLRKKSFKHQRVASVIMLTKTPVTPPKKMK